MVDPVTVGSVVAAALSMAAEAVVKGAVGEAVKDGYKALKERVAFWAPGEVAALEQTPGSVGRQTIIAEIINAQTEDDQKSVRVLAEPLVAALKECAPAIGLDIGRLTDLETHLGKITVTQGTGVRINEARGGRLEVDEVNVGPSARK